MNPADASIALTFDDGPDPQWTPLVLDALAAADARATFFVIAPLAAAHPELIARTQAEGHAVQLHCDVHVRHTDLSDNEVAADAGAALTRLRRLGVHPTQWRTPWGATRPYTELLARDFGLELVGWTADTEDWAGPSAEQMLAAVAAAITPGAVVLAHDGLGPGATRTGCAETVALIGPLAALAAARGLACRPVSDQQRTPA